MTKSEIFKKAHKIASHTYFWAGSYKIAFICALRDIYALLKSAMKIVGSVNALIIVEKEGKLYVTQRIDMRHARNRIYVDGEKYVELKKVRGIWGYWERITAWQDGHAHNHFVKLAYEIEGL